MALPTIITKAEGVALVEAAVAAREACDRAFDRADDLFAKGGVEHMDALHDEADDAPAVEEALRISDAFAALERAWIAADEAVKAAEAVEAEAR